jgi:hypothetical protein
LGAAQPTYALPGQTVDEVVAWIQAHPTLQPASGERLLVRKSDTPARRFTFQASIAPPGRASAAESTGFIRSEQITLFDIVNGVTRDRLEETLRVIYGPDISQDYAQARVLYTYPDPQRLSQAQNQNAPLVSALQGELREGDRFAYWLEIAQNQAGLAYTGQITVFLKDDINKLNTELQTR